MRSSAWWLAQVLARRTTSSGVRPRTSTACPTPLCGLRNRATDADRVLERFGQTHVEGQECIANEREPTSLLTKRTVKISLRYSARGAWWMASRTPQRPPMTRLPDSGVRRTQLQRFHRA